MSSAPLPISTGQCQFKTLVIVDLETTGLAYDEPKITELAMIAVPVSTLDQMKPDEELPRFVNKFVKFFNPGKAIRAKATELSDLDNNMLIHCAPFNQQTITAMETFLNSFPKPLCFVAHNGNVFDFPILFREILSVLSANTCEQTSQAFLGEIACADSLHFFREIYKLLTETENIDASSPVNLPSLSTSTIRRGYVEIPLKSEPIAPRLSMKLAQIYEREFERPSNLRSHRAEDDCLMLLAILKRYLPDWLEWVAVHHRSLKSYTFLPTLSTTTKTFSPKNTVNIKRPLKF